MAKMKPYAKKYRKAATVGILFDEDERIAEDEFGGVLVSVSVRGGKTKGHYFPKKKEIRVYLDPSQKIADLAKPGEWQNEVHSILAHELTHAADLGSGRKAARRLDTEGVEDYLRKTVEQKAYTRQVAEAVAQEISVFMEKPASAWMRRGKTATEFLQNTIGRQKTFAWLEEVYPPSQLNRVYRDILQFLETEGLLVIVEGMYS